MFTDFNIKQPDLVAIFLLIVFAGLVLPVAPVWIGLMYGLATLSLQAQLHHPSPRLNKVFLGAAGAVTFTMIAANFLALKADPIHYSKVIFDQHGATYPLVAGLFVTVYGLGLIGLLGYFAWRNAQDIFYKIAVVLLCAFALSYHVPTIVMGLSAGLHSSSETLAAFVDQTSALIKWNGWVIAALLTLIFARHQPDLSGRVLKVIGAAGLVMAGIVIAQHLAAEHFYVLEASQFGNYEFRVRATYTYHAPLSFLLAIATIVEIGRLTGFRTRGALKVIVLCIALSLNETRAISLGLTAAMMFLIAASVWSRAGLYRVIFCVCIGTFFAAQVYHIKMNANIPSTVVEQVSDSSALKKYLESHHKQVAHEVATTQKLDYVRSNAPRMELLQQGIVTLRGLWVGQGVGTISVPLSGYNNKGQMSAWSSHSFLVDIGLAGGVFSLFIFGSLMVVALGRGFLLLWRSRWEGAVFKTAAPTLGACLIFWMIASVFLPQEANFLLPLMFILTALSLTQSTNIVESAPSHLATKFSVWAKYILIVGAIFWSLLFSGTVMIPLVELAKLRHQNASTTQKIYTNSPKIAWVSQHLLSRAYPPLGTIALMPQTIDTNEELWLLWDPSYDHRYGPFIERMGRNYHRGYGRYPIFSLPAGWQAVNRLQPTLSIVYSGASQVQINADDAAPEYGSYYPNFAQWSSLYDLYGRSISQLNDGHYTSFWRMVPSEASIYIDAQHPQTLDAYTLTLSHQSDLPAYKTFSWRVAGSNNLTHWEPLDQRTNVAFSTTPIRDTFFFPKMANYYRYYSFTFSVPEEKKGFEIYLSDMKFFSAHKASSQAGLKKHQQ